jgi:hypothetical protein
MSSKQEIRSSKVQMTDGIGGRCAPLQDRRCAEVEREIQRKSLLPDMSAELEEQCTADTTDDPQFTVVLKHT